MAKSDLTIPEAFQILGLPEGAPWDEIKDAYRKLAKKWHPDVSKESNAKEKFESINAAYTSLEAWEEKGRPIQNNAGDIWDLIARRAVEIAEKKRRQKAIYKWAKMRREKADREQMQEYKKAIGVLFLILTLYFAGSWGYNAYIDYQINRNPAVTYAEVVGQSERSILIRYQANDRNYSADVSVKKALEENRSGNGMPIHLGDAFLIRYNSDDPRLFRLDFDHPHPNTLYRYILITQTELEEAYPEALSGEGVENQEIHSLCLALQINHYFGFEGMADIYYRDISVLENISNNTFTYYSLIKDDQFKKCFENCLIDFPAL